MTRGGRAMARRGEGGVDQGNVMCILTFIDLRVYEYVSLVYASKRLPILVVRLNTSIAAWDFERVCHTVTIFLLSACFDNCDINATPDNSQSIANDPKTSHLRIVHLTPCNLLFAFHSTLHKLKHTFKVCLCSLSHLPRLPQPQANLGARGSHLDFAETLLTRPDHHRTHSLTPQYSFPLWLPSSPLSLAPMVACRLRDLAAGENCLKHQRPGPTQASLVLNGVFFPGVHDPKTFA